MDWMEYAACKGMNPDDFMPERGENVKIRKAKKLCHSCPVLFACMAYGLEMHRNHQLHGIFGGLTQMEREDLLRQQDGLPPKNRRKRTAQISDIW